MVRVVEIWTLARARREFRQLGASRRKAWIIENGAKL
jgi:hypothetical protein